MRSPQTEQRPPAMGCMESRQTSQTGRREIRTRGSPQMRQSTGNSVAKRLSARTAARATIAVPTVPVGVARVRSQLLLKTSSRHSEVQISPELILLSIAVCAMLTQCADARPPESAVPFWFPYARLPARSLSIPQHQTARRPGATSNLLWSGATSAGSSPRTGPDATKVDPKYSFPRNSVAAMHILRNFRSGGNEIL